MFIWETQNFSREPPSSAIRNSHLLLQLIWPLRDRNNCLDPQLSLWHRKAESAIKIFSHTLRPHPRPFHFVENTRRASEEVESNFFLLVSPSTPLGVACMIFEAAFNVCERVFAFMQIFDQHVDILPPPTPVGAKK
jgi:hypothetical protein